MGEGQPIGLSATIKSLVEIPQTDSREFGKLAAQKVVFPSNAEGVEVGVTNFNHQGEGAPDNYLTLSAQYKLSQAELGEILQGALERGKTLRLPRGWYEATLRQTWTPEGFKAESGLPSFWHGKTSVNSYASTVDPEEVRFLRVTQSRHRAKVELAQNVMSFEADGEYKRHLRDIAETLNFRRATVRFSPEDAERVMEMSQQIPVGLLFAGQLRKQLKPQERTFVTISRTEVSLGRQGVIELNLRTGQIPDIEGQLHKDLYIPTGEEESQVVKLSRVYTLYDLIMGRRLKDMKRVVGMLEGIALGPTGNYAITVEQAKKLLSRELELLEEYYAENPEYIRNRIVFDNNLDFLRGDVVKRLAQELFGDEVVEPLQKPGLSVEEYVNLLASKDYIPGQFETGRLLSPYFVMERHLLEFYKQAYQQDPGKAAELYRRDYLNTKPLITINAEVSEDGSNINRLGVASEATINEFDVKQSSSSGHNQFSFGKIAHDSDARFYSRTSLNGFGLLPLQEWACGRVGISFTQ